MKLIFVYNASSDIVSKTIDFGHKVVSPSSYQCSICSLTHGKFREKDGWTKFKEETPIPMEFLYKDKLTQNYPELKNELVPFVAIQEPDSSKVRIALTAQDLSKFSNLLEFIQGIKLLTNKTKVQ